MTNIAAGAPYTATSTWDVYPAGPAVDVTGLTVTITRVADLAVVVATTSDGIVHLATGLYAYVWTPADDAAGDFVIVWDADGPPPAYETLTVGAATPVTVQDVVDYIGVDAAAPWQVVIGDTATYPAIADALAAETVVQLGKVTYRPATDDVPNPDNSDLREALMRRVQRNLAMRALPLAIQLPGSDGQPLRIGGTDPEIRRLEAARRRTVVG